MSTSSSSDSGSGTLLINGVRTFTCIIMLVKYISAIVFFLMMVDVVTYSDDEFVIILLLLLLLRELFGQVNRFSIHFWVALMSSFYAALIFRSDEQDDRILI